MNIINQLKQKDTPQKTLSNVLPFILFSKWWIALVISVVTATTLVIIIHCSHHLSSHWLKPYS